MTPLEASPPSHLTMIIFSPRTKMASNGVIPLELATFFTDVLQSKHAGRWYTGYPDDLRKRLRQHDEGQERFTRKRGPYELIYYEA